MTVWEAIAKVDDLKPNQYDTNTKIGWLSKLDGQIYVEVISTHEDKQAESFSGNYFSDQNVQLLVPHPFDEDLYVYFLQAQIDKENGETAKYNQSITLYNNAFLQYQSWYNRTHMPAAVGQRFLF